MKNVKNVNYYQINNQIPEICELKEIEILPSELAWQKYNWTKEYFFKKPKSGYFIWVKEQPQQPIFTCITLANKSIKQELQNLLIVEKNLKVELQGTCNALKKNLAGIHQAKGKIILRQGSTLQYRHIHSWGERDIVEPNYEFFLEKKAKLDYSYKVFSPPKKLKMKTLITLLEGSSANLNIVGKFSQTKTEFEETLILKEKGASGIVKLRLVGDKDSEITARSQVIAESESKGHLDCQGLLVDPEGSRRGGTYGAGKASVIRLIPELICKHPKAQITHEASIGRISGEELNYLRMRGLNEKEAINLIVNGFLERPIAK
ncbi:SufD family Fe-S cluster assembly protein [Candidatus Parcubacteria bacterium]|nr:SufD family Fe-S cluster assembly protein [Candidatus Parcubacteria bacterium]